MIKQQYKIYVINLARSPDRWERISYQLNSMGLQYERVEAVDGKLLSERDIRDNFNEEKFEIVSGHKLVAGEVGCALSHINIWKKIANENQSGAIIIEDDVVLKEPFLDFASGYTNEFKFDYLKLDFSETLYPYPLSIIKEYGSSECKFFELADSPYCTGGYFISSFGAKTFLNSTKQMFFPIDYLPQYTFPYTKQGIVLPEYVLQQGGNSTMEARIFVDENVFKSVRRKLLNMFSRKLLRDFLKYWKKRL